MSWGEEVAATYRDAGLATSLTLDGQAPHLYEDVSVELKNRSAPLPNGTFANETVLLARIPRLPNHTEPIEGWLATWGGRSYTVHSVGATPAVWIVEAK